MEFEWDEAKNEANIAKHGISFVGAVRIFDGATLRYEDNRRVYGETRIIAIGMLNNQEIQLVYTIRGESMRIISARRAGRNERRTYRQVFPG